MSSTDQQTDDVQKKILEYEVFVNERLRGDLQRVRHQQERVCSQLSNYAQIKTFVEQNLSKSFGDQPLKMQTDIGSNFYVQCVIPDATRIHLYCGLGFYVELTLKESLGFIQKKEKQLNDELLALNQQSNRIKAHIKLVLEGLRELQGL